jgi:glutaredoxin
MTIKLFTKPGCYGCRQAKELFQKYSINVELFEITDPIIEVRILEEAAYYEVLRPGITFPQIFIEDDDENIIRSYNGTVPESKDIEDLLKK